MLKAQTTLIFIIWVVISLVLTIIVVGLLYSYFANSGNIGKTYVVYKIIESNNETIIYSNFNITSIKMLSIVYPFTISPINITASNVSTTTINSSEFANTVNYPIDALLTTPIQYIEIFALNGRAYNAKIINSYIQTTQKTTVAYARLSLSNYFPTVGSSDSATITTNLLSASAIYYLNGLTLNCNTLTCSFNVTSATNYLTAVVSNSTTSTETTISFVAS